MSDEVVETAADERVLCIGCGYDLRGLPQDETSICPECGIPVTRSLMGDRLAWADPKWLSKITLGQTFISFGLATCFWAFVALLILPLGLAIASMMIPQLASPGAIGFKVSAGLLYAGLLGCTVGAILMTILDPRAALTEPIFSPRRVARWGTLALAAFVTCLVGLDSLLAPSFRSMIAIPGLVVCLAIATIAICAVVRTLASLLMRTSQSALARDAAMLERRLRWLLPLVGVLFLLPGALARIGLGNATIQRRGWIPCVSLILLIVLLTSIGKLAVLMKKAQREFRACLSLAREFSKSSLSTG